MDWSPQQAAALAAVQKWFRDRKAPQVFRVFGYAGTGKTTIAKAINEDIAGGSALFAAFTGKAALVLRKKGCTGASTLHSLIYKPVEDPLTGETHFELNPASDLEKTSLLIVDEVSMVGPELGQDLLSFGTKVLVLGDPAQLPPVNGEGFFTAAQPDILLTEIHRQAQDNPIIRMSMEVREGRRLDVGAYGSSKVILRKDLEREEVLRSDQVLCGLNRTRQAFNNRIRELTGRAVRHPTTNALSVQPVVGDRLVCLKNNRTKGLLNGSLWETKRVARKGKEVEMNVVSLDDPDSIIPVDVTTPMAYFEGTASDLPWPVRKRADEFDFGYCLTVHKSQGSQWDDVMLFDESASFRDSARNHLYTGITRAAERVTIIV